MWGFKKIKNPNAMPKADKHGWRPAKKVARNAAARREEAKGKLANRKTRKKR